MLEEFLPRRLDTQASPFLLCLPFSVTDEELDALRHDSRISGVVARPLENDAVASRFVGWLGRYLPTEGRWTLPDGAAQRIVVIGPVSCLREAMLLSAWRRGIRTLVALDVDGVRNRSLRRVLIQRGLALVARRIAKVFRRTPCFESTSIEVSWEGRFRRVLGGARLNPPPPSPIRVELILGSASLGGAETQHVLTACGLAEWGIDTRLIAVGPVHPSLRDRLSRAGVAWAELGTHPGHADPPQLRELLARCHDLAALPSPLVVWIAALFSRFAIDRPSVVHASLDLPNVWVGIAALLAGVPRIVLATQAMSPVHYHFYEPWFRPAYRVLQSEPSVVLTNNGSAGARDYERWLGIEPGRIRVLRNAVNPDELVCGDAHSSQAFRASLGIPLTAPVVGSVFRFAAEKRPLLWLRAAQQILSAAPEAHAVLIGAGPYEPRMRALVARSRVKDRLHLLAARADIGVPMKAMDLFMLTSAVEGSPVVLVNAGALGVPVLATDVGSVRETIDDGRSGWLVPPGAGVEAIAQQALRILRDPALRSEASRAGPAFVAARFGRDVILRETLAIYGPLE